jgi:hypothetical protein
LDPLGANGPCETQECSPKNDVGKGDDVFILDKPENLLRRKALYMDQGIVASVGKVRE